MKGQEMDNRSYKVTEDYSTNPLSTITTVRISQLANL